jgi:DNA topoisomerase II
VANPSFDSQSKDALTTSSTSFAAQCQLPANYLNKIVKQSGIVEEIVMDLESREKSKLIRATATRGTARQVNVPKLEDAHLAGTARGGECSLILTEGDSAKALAVAGLEVVGRERFGVLPLRGKILNVRGASPKAMAKNTLLMDLMKALGLQLGKKYTGSVWPEGLERTPANEQVHCGVHGQGMRYGKVLIMTDQDHDGSHIKGLLINFFQHFWPSLMEVDGFLQQFVTPLVKVRMVGSNKKVETFYSMPEYEEWLKQTQAEQHATGKKIKMSIKYYKGLGTNTAAEGRQYFKDLGRHRKLFFDQLEGEGGTGGNDSDRYGGESVDLAFSRHRASDRKQWLEEKYDPTKYIDPYQSRISVSEFINTDLMQFSVADNKRSLPSVVDGLKPSQRKVLYGCFRKKMTPADETKVVQLAGYIAEQTAYHHGESSLHATIINMAQDYVGANNLPLLAASGQFGTRAQGGMDFASPRYIFTTVTSAARLMFPEADDYNLEHLVEDGLSVEPVYYVPVVPNILINGSYGIGTGWSTFVPPHDPLVVADHTARLIRGESVSASPLLTTGRKGYPIPLDQLQSSPDSSLLFPWIRGFTGEIHRIQDNRGITFRSYGSLERKNKTTLVISELPYGLWTDEYKDFLIQLQEAGGIKRYAEDHTHTSVKFTLTGTKDQLDQLESNSMLATIRKMRLSSVMSGRNMHAFNKDGKITHYDTPESVCEEHYAVRLQAYETRKDYLTRKFSHEVEIHRNKSKFVQDILSGDIELLQRGAEGRGSRSESDLVEELRSRGYASREVLTQMLGGSDASDIEGTATGDHVSMSPESSDYRYLLEMPIHSLTEERMAVLRKSAEQSEGKLNELLASSIQDLWMRDLTAFTDKVEKLPQSSGFKRRF